MFVFYFQGDQDKAQICLEKAIEEYYPDRAKFRNDTSQDMADRLTCAKVGQNVSDEVKCLFVLFFYY